jgi:hypothetical protein
MGLLNGSSADGADFVLVKGGWRKPSTKLFTNTRILLLGGLALKNATDYESGNFGYSWSSFVDGWSGQF